MNDTTPHPNDDPSQRRDADTVPQSKRALRKQRRANCSPTQLKRIRRVWAILLVVLVAWTARPLVVYAIMGRGGADGGQWALSAWAAHLHFLLCLAYVPVGIVMGMVMLTYAGRARGWGRMILAGVMSIVMFGVGFYGFCFPVVHSVLVAEHTVRAGGQVYCLVDDWGGWPDQDGNDPPTVKFAARRFGLPGIGYVGPTTRINADFPFFFVLPERLRGKGQGFYTAPTGEVVYLDDEANCLFVYDPPDRALYGVARRGDSPLVARYDSLRNMSPFILFGPDDECSPEEAQRLRDHCNALVPQRRPIAFPRVFRDDADNHPNAQVRQLAEEMVPPQYPPR
jgi:hypothetical protein